MSTLVHEGKIYKSMPSVDGGMYIAEIDDDGDEVRLIGEYVDIEAADDHLWKMMME